MKRVGIIVADAARARFIDAEVVDDAAYEGSPRLTEHVDLAHPLGELPARDTFTDRMSRKPSGGGPHGAGPTTDDHRERHELEDERRFVREILETAERFIRERAPSSVVLAAAPHLLGLLRSELEPTRWSGVQVLELPRDLSKASLSQLGELLIERGLLPKASLPRAGVYRPRGQEPSTR